MSELSMRTRAAELLRNGKWSRWINRATWTLIDRALFALSNFALNVALARWLSPEAYGAFALAFSAFLMMGGMQSSLVIGPLLVYGPGRYRARYQAYLGLVIKGQMVISSLFSICLALGGAGFLVWGSRDIGTILLALAVSGPFILLLWLLRQSGYVHLQPKRAAGAGAIYMALLLASSYLLYRLSALSPTTTLFLMAAASLIVATWLAIRQKAKPFEESLRGDFAREIALEHWRYARWTLPARLLDAGYRNLFFFVLPIWGGLGATGALRALMNLIMPIAFMEGTLGVVTVPALVRARNSGTMLEKMLLGMAFFVISAVVYGAGLILFRNEIIELLYAGRYGDHVDLMWLIALIPVARSASMILSSALRAMERPSDFFWATLAGAICATTIGLGAVAIAGTLGAVMGLLLSAFVTLIALLWLVRSAFRSEGGKPGQLERRTPRQE